MLFRGLPVDYRISAYRIILRKTTPPLFHTIRGIIIDEQIISIPGASIVIINTMPLFGSTSDTTGKFKITNVPVGRVSVQISSVGFVTRQFQDLLLGTGKELVLDVTLGELVTAMGEVEIFGNRDADESGSLFNPEGRTFTTEEAKRFAGSLADPLRRFIVRPGVWGAREGPSRIWRKGPAPRHSSMGHGGNGKAPMVCRKGPVTRRS